MIAREPDAADCAHASFGGDEVYRCHGCGMTVAQVEADVKLAIAVGHIAQGVHEKWQAQMRQRYERWGPGWPG